MSEPDIPKAKTTSVSRVSGRTSLSGVSLVLLAWSITAGSAVSKLIDNEVRVYSADRTSTQVADSNLGGLVGVSLFWTAVGVSLVCLLRRSPGQKRLMLFPSMLFLTIAWWFVCSQLFQASSGDGTFLFGLGILLVAGAVFRDPPTLNSVRGFNYVRDAASVLMLLTSIVHAPTSQLPCRPDKCGIFDSLFLGFFYSENAAAQFILLLVPTAIAIRSRVYLCFTLVLAGMFLASTGSRTSLIDFAVLVVFIIAYRAAVLNFSTKHVHVLWRAAPAGFYIVSIFVFLAYSSGELTGRGAIYEGIRSQLTGSSLLTGSGPETMDRVFAEGFLGNFEAFGEHGQAPHVIAQAGLPGLVMFGLGLLGLMLLRTDFSPREITGLAVVLAGSLQFVTEPGWTLNARTLNIAMMLLAIGLFVRVEARAGEPGCPAYLY